MAPDFLKGCENLWLAQACLGQVSAFTDDLKAIIFLLKTLLW
ncbi:MAG: hypothetical protein JWQ27_2397 [Ferruginibacter sp.]|nr:hypothetical protein [Ferruginibacter sp.]